MKMGQGVGTGAGTWQGVGTGTGHGGITCVLQTQFLLAFCFKVLAVEDCIYA